MISQLNLYLPRFLNCSGVNLTKIVCLSSTAKESNLAKLRKKTGLAFTLCKKALELHNNDMNAAELYLKEESIKHGYAKIQKLQSRRAVQGLVGMCLNNETKKCALLEVNCETDFVARNKSFRQLVAQLTSSLLDSSTNKPLPSTLPNTDLAIKNVFNPDHLSLFNDHLSQAVTQLGENIKLSRGLIVQLADTKRSDLHLFGHVHAAGEAIADINNVRLGKYGAVVIARQLSDQELKKTIKSEEKDQKVETKNDLCDPSENVAEKKLTDEEIDNQDDVEFAADEPISYTTEDVGKILCQQIIGMNPTNLKKSTELLAKEKELIEKGFKIPEDSEYLLDQATIVDPSLSVLEFCNNHGISVLDFVRFECGEEIES